MASLTAEHVEAWFVLLRQNHTDRSGTERPPIQATTWNNYYARIKSFNAYCVRRRWTRVDQLAHEQSHEGGHQVRQQPSVDLLLAMLANATEPRNRAVLACAMNTGLRAGEIERLRVGDVDLDTLTLRVWVSKSQVEDDMPITSDLAAELNLWLAAYAQSIERPLLPTDRLLPACTGPRYRWRTLTDETRECYHVPSTYVPHRPVGKLYRIAQAGLRSVGLPTLHEGIHTLRRAVARHYYEALAAERGHDGAIRIAGGPGSSG
jgi:integrase